MKTRLIHLGKAAIILLLFIASLGLTFSPWTGYTITGTFLEEMVSKLRVFSAEVYPERVYLQIDKPLCEPGESLWYTAYVRNAMDMTPSEKSGVVHVELYNPKGALEQKQSLVLNDGLAKGDFFIDEEKPGGIYKLKAYTAWQKNDTLTPLFEKEIQVQKTMLPRLKMKLDFPEKGYAPGAEVTANLSLETLENVPLSNHEVKWLVKLEDKQFLEKKAVTDEHGKLALEFELPKKLKSADGLLNVMLNYHGQAEAISRSIPIALHFVNLDFYPEGGDCISGLPSRVAFKAVDEHGKPVNVKGDILDRNKQKITSFSSYHHGMGAFQFTPGEAPYYYARLTTPAGIDSMYALPMPQLAGFTVQASLPEDQKIGFTIYAQVPETISVLGQMRGKPLFASQLVLKEGENNLRVPVGNFPMGVAQFTFFDSYNDPVAERLVFVRDEKQMKLEISTNKEKYMPREKVEMKIKAVDKDGDPVAAGFSLAVADDKLLSYADDKTGNILSRLLLEPEVKGKVEEPNFYFDPKEEKAAQARDYLLMTQGWRRFTWKEISSLKVPEQKIAAEHAEFNGYVQELYTQRPIPDVKISVEGSNKIWKTDKKGYFSLSGIELYETATLKFEYKGMMQEFICNRYLEDMNVVFKLDKNPGFFLSKDGNGRIVGRIVDAATQEPVLFANVELEKDGVKISGTATDLEGYFSLFTDATGSLQLRTAYIGYQPIKLVFIKQQPRQVKVLGDVKLNRSVVQLQEVTIVEYRKPLIEIDATTSGETITREEIRTLPTRSVNQAVAIAGGVYSRDNGRPRITGARTDATEYYVDGMKVRGLLNAPQNAIEQIPVITTGTPAEYGDVTGGYARFADVADLTGIARTQDSRAMRFSGNASQVFFYGGRQESQSGREASPQYYRAREFPVIKYPTTKVVGPRKDFRHTIYWNGNIQTNKDGEAVVEFYNSDAVTSFRAVAEGISGNGLMGRGEKTYFTQMPFNLSVKVPPVVLAGDKFQIPVTLQNNTGQELKGRFSLGLPQSWSLSKAVENTQTIPANSAKTLWLDVDVMNYPGEEKLSVAFDNDDFSDSYQEQVVTMSRGFPRTLSFSAKAMEKVFDLEIDNPLKGTLAMEVTVFPGITGQLLQGVESMLREPYGCFEQTSSTIYPNVLVLDYLRESGTLSPDIEKKALALLDKGYHRLLTFETPKKGYDWFGHAPGHQGLTAYGLMEFSDMRRVYSGVSDAMLSRTANWMLDSRDGKGNFQIRSGWSYNPSEEITNAYIVNALIQAGYTNISRETEHALAAARKSNDPYQLALMAQAMYQAKREGEAAELHNLLLKQQHKDGSWVGHSYSITRSGGRNLALETTALALLALLDQPQRHYPEIRSGVNFILENRSGYGSFGSTQATILCLKALTAYTRFAKRTAEAGALTVIVNGKEAGKANWEADQQGIIKITGLARELRNGKNRVAIKFNGMKEPLPFAVLATWNEPLPPSDAGCKVGLEVKLSSKEVQQGETVRLSATITNKTGEAQASPVAIIGIPAGLSLQPWQLRELQEKKAFDFYEILDNNIVFYFRGIESNGSKTIHLDLKSEIKGTYEGEAASTYLYYDNDEKSWASPGAITVK